MQKFAVFTDSKCFQLRYLVEEQVGYGQIRTLLNRGEWVVCKCYN